MYFKQKSNVIFRNYESFGYITDNRNFGYTKADQPDNYIGDKILSESGAVFFSVLEKTPQTLTELSNRIHTSFPEADIRLIKKDAQNFYTELEYCGFVISGNTFTECNENDVRFSYKTSKPDYLTSSLSHTNLIPAKSTQYFFDEYFKGKPQLTNIHIEITSLCNERCLHCYIPHENKVKSIESDLFYEVLEQCKKMNLLHLTLSGGEPMLHTSFCEFLRKCREYDFSINILSNLTLLNDEVLNEFKASPLLGVQVSLYSMNPVIHDEITQIKGSFRKTKNSILKLHENNIPVQISCPILKQNKHCYEEVIEWANSKNIHAGDDYVILAKYNHDTQNLNYRLSTNEIKDLIEKKIRYDLRYVKNLQVSVQKKKNILPDDHVCSICNSSLCISENGNVYPCAGWQDYVLGNVKKNSLADIWNNSDKVKYLRNLRNNDFPECIECTDKELCTMCMVRNANESSNGNHLEVNKYFCNIANIKRNMLTGRLYIQNQ